MSYILNSVCVLPQNQFCWVQRLSSWHQKFKVTSHASCYFWETGHAASTKSSEWRPPLIFGLAWTHFPIEWVFFHFHIYLHLDFHGKHQSNKCTHMELCSQQNKCQIPEKQNKKPLYKTHLVLFNNEFHIYCPYVFEMYLQGRQIKKKILCKDVSKL